MTHTISNSLMEKRKHKRIQYGRTVNIRTMSGIAHQLDVLDYSMGGMGLVSKVPFEPGEVLEFDSIMTLDGERRPLDLKGEVRHVQEQYQEFAFGVSFL